MDPCGVNPARQNARGGHPPEGLEIYGPPEVPRGSAAGGNLAIFVIFDIDFPAKNESDCMVGIPSEG